MHKYECQFGIGDKVVVDGDQRFPILITAVLWRNERPSYECSWFADGNSRTAWIEEWRVGQYNA